jgi:hypothetical protein
MYKTREDDLVRLFRGYSSWPLCLPSVWDRPLHCVHYQRHAIGWPWTKNKDKWKYVIALLCAFWSIVLLLLYRFTKRFCWRLSVSTGNTYTETLHPNFYTEILHQDFCKSITPNCRSALTEETRTRKGKHTSTCSRTAVFAGWQAGSWQIRIGKPNKSSIFHPFG